MSDETGKTVQARIAIAVRSDGVWDSVGFHDYGDDETMAQDVRYNVTYTHDDPEWRGRVAVHFVTVAVPVPEPEKPQELAAEVDGQ